MRKIPLNVVFVYCLLAIDLFVNLTDNLPSPTKQESHREQTISFSTSIIFVVQIAAIFCVMVDLVLHFFNASDQVRQFHECRDEKNAKLPFSSVAPMPQRVALKLVLDRYWWSLLVGSSYLVLTIILQIVRLDPIWNHEGGASSLLATHSRLTSSTVHPVDGNDAHRVEKLNDNKILQENSSTTQEDLAVEGNLLPVFVLLVHKLTSTFYYVSVVVVYRATSNQIVKSCCKTVSPLH